ncbi:hypothetical protein TeGR_g1169 [Tetraparma gracilis]|uniref:DUF2061 domain-containing protein n=1 Tax=Tetraparma gracilis TaxID=2962635 RepID=A0ABQ6MZG2_9STRA|nr:hypothetical protein TeGR_g1169 [Tetraparma gracilis]
MWRLIAGSVTFLNSLQYLPPRLALSVVLSDFLSKALTMFLGERLMNASKVGRGGGGESRGRSVAKALAWRAVAIINTVVAAVVVGGSSLKIAGRIAGLDAVVKTGMMVGYERGWDKVEWGREYDIDFSI